ncbi:hypothetical protein Z517_10659 [Fonsecaea pedrosoi CBS 271.37]|uniref:SNF2 family helicase/ATPase n=1 Tax=Fonsecaea pedrosoi CBS 271.37 TaxID=1442368 RepID=A0A0D2GU22_9EURO|nr:uncharacterized protein Z517_10659 [Fonsecaea pedrosoi CBS 271.37]KIW75914.1 hypothetical protein Z517_10659 [Fonsecaea pedrosoi CBS 271.37]
MDPVLDADEDPRDWSIDQVVYELCQSPIPRWLSKQKPQSIPDRHGLEDALRRNHVDGDNLLALDMPTLKEDLGISSFGQRRAIMKAIEFFRATSKSYQQMLFQADSIARMHTATFASPQLTQSRTSIVPQSPAHYGLGVQPSIEPSHTLQSPIASQQQSVVKDATFISSKLAASNFQNPSGSTPRPRRYPPQDDVQTRSSPTAASPSEDATVNFASKACDQLPLLQHPEREYSLVNGKKKIAPILLSHLPEATPTKLSRESYLGQEAHPLQDVFYCKAPTGFTDEIIYQVAAEEPDSFVISTKRPSGQRRIIARLIKSFLRQSTTTLWPSGQKIKIPYDRSRIKPPYSKEYFTSFPRGKDGVRVHKAEDFTELNATQDNHRRGSASIAPVSSNATWLEEKVVGSNVLDLDYLLDKYPVESSDGLPLYGDSGDENDLDEDTWREIEKGKAEEENLRRTSINMAPVEVEVAINDAIDELKQEWYATKFFAVQRKAYRHWLNAARQNSRKEKIAYFNHCKTRFLVRLDILKREIAKNVWRTPAEVKRQCQSLELTVYQYHEYNYYGQIMLRDTAPPKPDNKAPVRSPRHHDLEEGEEILESDSEIEISTEEGGQSFVDDSSEEGSIHHIPDSEDWNPVIPSTTKQPDPSVVDPRTSSPAPPSNTRESPLPDVHANDADVESDTEDEIIAPARRKIKRMKTETTQTPNAKHTSVKSKAPRSQQLPSDTSDLDGSPRLANSRYRSKGRSSALVDLTFSSHSEPERIANDTSTDFSVHTPKLNPIRAETPQDSRSRVLIIDSSGSEVERISSRDDTILPAVYDFQGIRRTSWSDIDPIDKRRALAKAVYDLEPDQVSRLDSFLDSMTGSRTAQETVIVDGLVALDEDKPIIKGLKQKHQLSAQLLVLLYLTYICGQNALDEFFELSEAHRDEAFADKDRALATFYSLLEKIILTYFAMQTRPQTQTNGQKRKRDLSVPDDQITDATLTDSLEEVQPSSHKKRKRKVEESQEAKIQQFTDQVRIQLQEERRKNMANKLALMQVDGSAAYIINTVEPPVELHRHIAQCVKPHQVNGIQFMWREIVEDPKRQGCILAHTMGLGKTMQVASLLVTIALCNQSNDKSVRNHIPEHLQKSKTLILGPSSLLNNWEDELLMWTPDPNVLGVIHKADSIRKQDNIRAIKAWSRQGGILLIGYERFRSSITDSIRAKAKGTGLLELDLERILLEEPNLVIADEAHILKNPKSQIGQIAKRLKTTSRIALSGSPLNNHLEEYHTMVDWIAPGYLGDMVQFRSKYSEPIMEGLYSDSSAYEKRISLRKLHVLKRDLDPKINRADISAIEKDMPSKTEFFITIPLTDLQRQAYDIYIHHMLQSFGVLSSKNHHARIMAWLSMLSWLCHHPAAFVAKIKERYEKPREDRYYGNDTGEPNESTDETSGFGEVSENVALDIAGSLQEAMQQALQVLPDPSDRKALYDPRLSYRTLAVKRIVEKAIEAGDKTLIFSHSLPTLDYLGQMLRGIGVSFCRIDGSTKPTDRQAFTKEFNNKDNYQVFLISIRSGGLGLNLQGANRVIIFDFSFNPTWEQQAIGRAYRLNQKTPVFVYRFQAGGTFEDKLFNTAVFKTQLFGRVVDKKNPRRHASKAAHTEYLFPVRDVPQVDFRDSLGKDPKVLDAIIHELDFVRSIVLTETFQKEDDEQLNDEEQKVAEEEYNDQRLQREDPIAWQAKQRQSLSNTNLMSSFSNLDPTLHSGRATLGQRIGPGAHRSKSSAIRPILPAPFERADLNNPQPPQAHHTTIHMPGSYDDTFQAFVQLMENRHRAVSTEPDW